MTIRKMIGDILAARVTDDAGSWLFELKTDGRVAWVQPHRQEEAVEIFFTNFNVEEDIQDEIEEALVSGKLTLEQMDMIFG